MPRKLRYIGDGAFVPGYPAADFTCESDKEADELVKHSGCYEFAAEKADEKPTTIGKEGGDK